MQLRVDHPSVAFASDDGADLFHFGDDVHFSHGGGIIAAAVFFGDITQSP